MKKRRSWVGVVALSAAMAVAGCGASKGSNTACSDFRGMSTEDQKTVVSNALKDHGHANPSPVEVDTGWLSAKGYCFLHGGSEKVGGIFGG